MIGRVEDDSKCLRKLLVSDSHMWLFVAIHHDSVMNDAVFFYEPFAIIGVIGLDQCPRITLISLLGCFFSAWYIFTHRIVFSPKVLRCGKFSFFGKLLRYINPSPMSPCTKPWRCIVDQTIAKLAGGSSCWRGRLDE
jgi:hypothetical protein